VDLRLIQMLCRNKHSLIMAVVGVSNMNIVQAVILVHIEFFEDLLNGLVETFVCDHGLHNIRIIRYTYDPGYRCFAFFITSPDVEAYIAYCRAVEQKLQVYDGLPVVGFIMSNEMAKKQNSGDIGSDTNVV
jgi:hypothetical protein